MNYFFQIVGVITTIIFSIFFIERIIYKFDLIKLVKKLYYRILYQNYEIWIKSKRLTKDECINFLNKYQEALKKKRISENDKNLTRYKKAVSKRLEKLK
jgi:hypothetical protein